MTDVTWAGVVETLMRLGIEMADIESIRPIMGPPAPTLPAKAPTPAAPARAPAASAAPTRAQSMPAPVPKDLYEMAAPFLVPSTARRGQIEKLIEILNASDEVRADLRVYLAGCLAIMT